MRAFTGSLLPVGFNYAPRGWAVCDGQLLSMQHHQARFSLLGTRYGGDGRSNFALPNMTGSKAITDACGAPLTWLICTGSGIYPVRA